MFTPESRRTEIDGQTLAWREAGQGPALVFIHGMGGNSRNWETQYAQFADRYRVIGWDAPGYGASDDWPMQPPEEESSARSRPSAASAWEIMCACGPKQDRGCASSRSWRKGARS